MAPKRVPELLARTDPNIIPHFLQSIEGNDFVLKTGNKDEGHDNRKCERAENRTRRIDVSHHAFRNKVPLPCAYQANEGDQADHLVSDMRNLLFH
jgi:hypothetical protein